MKKIILSVMWIVILIIIPMITFKYDDNAYSNDVPYISSVIGLELIDIDIKVNRDNSIDVVEAMTFNLVEGVPFNGIKLNLPLREKIKIDSNNYRRNIKVSDISSDDVSVDKKRRFNYLETHLGKNNENMEPGMYTYTLKYHYDLGNNTDDFIYKVFSNRFKTDIFNMSVTITFDDTIDQNKVKFISDDTDVTNRVTFGVEENVIRASLSDFVLDNDFIVDVDLDNYFSKMKSTDGYIAIIMLIIICLLTIILIILSFMKRRKTNDAIELYSMDIRSLLGLIVLMVLESLVYVFMNDLSTNMSFMYLVSYGFILLSGLVFIIRLD